jgi:hypothetical protein
MLQGVAVCGAVNRSNVWYVWCRKVNPDQKSEITKTDPENQARSMASTTGKRQQKLIPWLN